ncbi:hypothetical protein GCM10023069_54720 [Shinella granuli]
MSEEMYIWRPILADPRMCEYIDLNTRLTIDDLANFHEALDLKEAIHEHARKEQERKR